MLLAQLWSEAFLSRGFPGSIHSGVGALCRAALYGAGFTSEHIPDGVIHIGAIWYLEALFIALVEVRLLEDHAKAWAPLGIILLAVLARWITERTGVLASILEYYGRNSLAILVSHLVIINLGAKYHICHLLDLEPNNTVFLINLSAQLVLTALFAYACRYLPVARSVFGYQKRTEKE